MMQSSFTALTLNMFYVTLSSSVPLSGSSRAASYVSSSTNSSVFVMSGLGGAQMHDLTGDWIQLFDISNGFNLFCVDGVRGRARWNATSGEIMLAICGDQTMVPNINYAFAFRIMNPLIYRRRPPVQISLVGGVLWRTVNFTYAGSWYDPFFIDIGRPTFLTRCMNQSVPYAGLNNTLTVSLVVNQAMAEAARRFIITNLRGAIVNTSTVQLYGGSNNSQIFCVGDQPSQAVLRNGDLNLTLCQDSEGLAPYENYVFSFDILNPSFDQSPPSINIKAYDASNRLVVDNALCRPSGISGATEWERLGYADPMSVTVPGFRVSTMTQSSCIGSTVNTLYVTLQSSLPLSGSARTDDVVSTSSNPPVFVITGLRGIDMYDSTASYIRLFDVGWGNGGAQLFCAENAAGRAVYNATSGDIFLVLCPNQRMYLNWNYGFAFRIMNPTLYLRRPPIAIALSGGLLWRNVSFTYPPGCTSPKAPACCAQPLFIDVGRPGIQACMRQSVPYVDSNNTLTISLVPNQAMAETVRKFSIHTLRGLKIDGSTIQLENPPGWAKNDSSIFCVGTEPNLASWGGGVLNLTFCASDFYLTPFEPYVVQFNLVNPNASQSAPPLTMTTYDENGTVILRNSMCRPSTVSTATEYERTGLRDPMEIVEVGFRVRTLTQSSCTSLTLNTIYATLQSTVAFYGKEPPDPQVSTAKNVTFVMKGFLGQNMNDATSSWIQLYDIWYNNGWYWYNNGGLNLFCFNGTRGRAGWNATSGEVSLALCPDKSINVGVNYAFSFRIMNPLIWRRPPTVQISMIDGVLWKNANMSYPATASRCNDPLFIDIGQPAFVTSCMNQTRYFAGVNNTLTISLVFNQAMAERVTRLTLLNLRGLVIDSSTVELYGPNNSSQPFCVGGEPSLASWRNGEMNLTLCNDLDEGLLPYEPYVISFDIINPSVDQSSPSITIRAFDSQNKLLVSNAICKPSGQTGASEYQRSGYADPLIIVTPGFRVRSMAQSSCYAEQLNTLYVTLQSSIPLVGRAPPDYEVSSARNVTFVMRGFQGQQMYDLTGAYMHVKYGACIDDYLCVKHSSALDFILHLC
jgi:hypothetical protein